MTETRKYKLIRLLRMTMWSLTAVGLFVLLLSAMRRNNQLSCKGIDIVIDGYNHEIFISEAEVKKMLEKELTHKIEKSAREQLDLRKLERLLRRNPWISKAQLYIDNQQLLHVNIGERMPVARVFTRDGRSFYIDSSTVVLPLSVNEIADVPVFTNLPDAPSSDHLNEPLLKGKEPVSDSILWRQVSNIGNFIKKDSFLLMQIGQIDITPNADYVMYPAIGSHWVEFGSGDAYEQKLRRLSAFYKKIFGKVGLNKYEMIDLRYDKQIVARLRGKPEGRVDSAAAMRTFEALVNKTVMEANDTTVKIAAEKNEKIRPEIITAKTLQPVDGRMVTESPDVAGKNESIPAPVPPTKVTRAVSQPAAAPVRKQPVIKSNILKPAVKDSKPKPKPAEETNRMPKAVMPKTNEY